MLNETITTIVGNVITDVKQRRITDGTRVASFRVASNERRFDKETQTWVNGDSLYVTVTCWRKLAMGVSASLTKGDPVIVTGRLFTRGYELEGQKRSVTELEAVAVGPDLSRCLADVTRASRKATEDVAPEGAVLDEPPASEEELEHDSTEVSSGPLVALPTQNEGCPSGKTDRVGAGIPVLAFVGSS